MRSVAQRTRPRKSRLRKLWASKAGIFRRHRERVEAEAIEAHTEAAVEPADAPDVSALPPGGDGAALTPHPAEDDIPGPPSS